MSNINKLRQALGGDGVHTNQFRVILNPPAILGIATSEVERLQVLCKSVTPPELNIGTITVYQGGKPLPYRGDREYSPVTIDYLYDINMKVHDTLYNWQNLMVSVDGFTASRTRSDYASTAIIEILRLKALGDPNPEEPDVIKRYILRDVFPTNVPQPNYNQETMNEFASVSVTLSYTDFTTA